MQADATTPRATSLRIAILAHGLRVGGGVSVGLNMIAAFGRVSPENEYFCVVPPGLGYEEAVDRLPHGELLTHAHRGLLSRWWFERFDLPRAVRAFRPDVVLALGGRGLLKPGCPQAAFPQDPHFYYPLRHFGNETRTARLKKRYHMQHFARQLRATQLVLVQTEVVQRRLRETFDYRGRTLICGTSVSPFLAEGRSGRSVPEPLGRLRGKMKLLYLTRFYAHKNLEGVIELFRRYRDALRDVVVITTVASDQHPNAAKYLRAIDQYQLADQVINVGPVPHGQVAAFYEHCDALFMPTLLETFGIPYLEAMYFDLPVLTSDLDFAHAVCGDAASFFDPWEPASMKEAILRLKLDPALRERLIAAGRERVARRSPTWDEIAENVLRNLHTIVSEYRGQA